MKVKGSLLINMVKLIRANKDKDWDKWLGPEDWEIIDAKVLPSAWYPGDTLNNIGLATFKEIAGGDLPTARAFGKFLAKGIGTLYKNILVDGDPAATIEKFTVIQQMFLKETEGVGRVVDSSPGLIITDLVMPEEERKLLHAETIEAFYYMMAGLAEGLVEATGGKNVSLEMEKVELGYEYRVKWE